MSGSAGIAFTKKNPSVIVARFNFTLTGYPSNVSGWITLEGDPYTAVMSASDTSSGSSITISTVGTGATYWNWNSVAAAGYVAAAAANADFEQELGSGYLFNQSTTYTPGTENLLISGLSSSELYDIDVLVCRTGGSDNRGSLVYCVDNNGTEMVSVNAAPTYNNVNSGKTNVVNNAGTLLRLKDKVPNGSGQIKMHICAAAGWTFGYINAIRVTKK